MLKKVLALLLIGVLMCTAFTLVSSADVGFLTDVTTAVEGNSLKVTVKYHTFNFDDGIVSASGNMIYDSKVLEYQGAECDYPEEWGDKAANWSKVVSDGNAFIGVLYDSHETGHGAKEPLTIVVTFKILKTGVTTALEYKNILVTTSDDLNSVGTMQCSFSTKLENGNTEVDVSMAPDVSEPEISNEVSEEPVESTAPVESEEPVESTPDGDESVATPEASDESSAPAEDKGGCFSSIASGAVVITSILGLAIGFIRKKK